MALIFPVIVIVNILLWVDFIASSRTQGKNILLDTHWSKILHWGVLKIGHPKTQIIKTFKVPDFQVSPKTYFKV